MNISELVGEVVKCRDMPEKPPSDFAEWLESELERRGWTQAEFARQSKLTTAQVARVLTREQDAGIKFARNTARAFRMNELDVFIAAGLIRPQPDRTPVLDMILNMIADMDVDEQENALALIETLYRRRKRAQKIQR